MATYKKKMSLQSWRARPKQAIAVYPSVYTMSYATGPRSLRLYGAKLAAAVYAFDDQDMDIVVATQADYQHFSSRLIERFEKRPEFLDKLIIWSESRTDYLYNFLNRYLNQKIIIGLSNTEIARRYLGYIDKYVNYHLHNTPAWWLGAITAEEKLRAFLENRFPERDYEKILAIIIDPLEYKSENVQEELSLLELVLEFKRLALVKGPADLPSAFRVKFQTHVKRFSSLPFGYKTGVVWTEADFFKRLVALAKRQPAVLKAQKVKEIKLKIKQRDRLLTSLKLPRPYYNLVIALRQLAYLQELKKTTQTRSHPLLQLIVKPEIAKRLHLKAEYLDFMSEEEVARSLRQGKVSALLRRELPRRLTKAVNIVSQEKSHWLTGKQAQDFIKLNGLLAAAGTATEIKGQPACRGLARGYVKICQFSTEINKLKRGDILVTAMTTPDFVPAMRRAAAIVTDEGGITSHAAIVARELGKPCIIGAKVAAKILKDGDYVEVDANRGVVRKLQDYHQTKT